MNARSRFGGAGIFARHLLSHPTPSVLVAALIALVVLVVALAPRALSAIATAELRHHLNGMQEVALDFRGDTRLEPMEVPAPGTSAATLFSAVRSAVTELTDQPDPLAGILGDPGWFVTMAPEVATSPEGDPGDPAGFISLAIDLDWESRVTFVEGGPPEVWAGTDEPLDDLPQPPLDVAISVEAAELMGVEAGDVLDYSPAPLRVAGVYDLLDPEDPYWQHAFSLGAAHLTAPSLDAPQRVVASAYVAPDSAVRLRSTLQFATLTISMPVDPSELDYADTSLVAEQSRAALGAEITLETGESVHLFSQLEEAITTVRERVTALSSLLALTASGPLGVAFAVFALGARSVVDRRRPALALAAARGAAPRQLRGAMFVEGALLAIPGSVLAIIAASFLVPTRVGAEAIVLPVIVALSVPLLFAATASPRGLGAARSDLAVRSRSGVRWVVEAGVVGLAALSIFLLARRGLVESSAAVGIDPLLVMAPLLLAAAACVAVLRIYPIPLLALQRAMRRRRNAVGLLGAARAVRDPALGFPAALALVVGVSVAVFSAVMTTTVASALATTAREGVGADIRIAANDLGDDVLAAVADVPGVHEVAPVAVVERVIIGNDISGKQVIVVFADTAILRILQPQLPDLTEATGGLIPFVASDRVEGEEIEGETLLAGTPAEAVAVVRQATIPAVTRPWLLVDSAFASDITAFEPETAFLLIGVDDGFDAGAVAGEVYAVVVASQRDIFQDDVEIVDAATELAAARTAPLAAGLEGALSLALLLSAGLSIVTVLLASISASGRRNRTVGVLRTLGMSPRQTRGLIGWEMGPVAITAALAGLGLGMALPWVVTSTLDLRPFVGGFEVPRPIVDSVLVLVVVLGFVAVAIVAGLVAAAIGRRIHPAGILKMGEE